MTEIIVTDLTRFSNRDHLCVAGLSLDGRQCIRPLLPVSVRTPGYLTYDECRNNGVLPGTILRADYTPPPQLDAPHTEDSILSGQLHVIRAATSDEFRAVLEASSVRTLREGFGVQLNNGQKVLPAAPPPARSIITLRLHPRNLQIVPDGYNDSKVRAHVTDGDGLTFRFLSITDLGFFDYVGNPATRRLSIADALAGIHAEHELFLRIGLGRRHAAEDGRDGYWLQVNGIYTFPNYNLVLRQY